ncbi:TolC family protein [Variovorax ginsengisoli]|uniref:Cobalt-zinc-cadmium efflux system outer membrane protein n=1 Tax=Variovorax ginsengisoli TaxID=363844 RepID=A0ABT9SG64_9BURK|nr:TolC family protein [Variovorax ginsengisoli]MDP9902791.1 cobalt-zinc-cadmium efflux system outer membrane protein [Variovorax ginsengisoli]
MCRFFVPLALALTSLAGASALAQQNHGATAPTGAQAAAAPVSPPPLTLATAIRTALGNHPELSAARREIEATEGARMQAGTFQNPTLSAEIEGVRSDTRTTAVLLSQPIELGGKRSARIEAAERAADVARLQLEVRQVELQAEVTAAFFAALIAQDRVQLAQGALDLAGKGSLAASHRVRAGKVSPIEETKAKVAEAGVRLEGLQAQGDLQTSVQQLRALMGRPPAFQVLDGDALMLPAARSAEAVEQRLADAPALRQARLQVQRFAALAALEQAKRMPDLTLTAGAMRDREAGRNQAVVGISVPLPFFDTNHGNIVEALRRQDKAEDELLAVELRLRAEAGAARQRHVTALAEVDALQKEILPGARAAFDAATKGFEMGKFAYLDVLDAQRTLLQARSQHLRALAEAHRAATDLDRLLGGPVAVVTSR